MLGQTLRFPWSKVLRQRQRTHGHVLRRWLNTELSNALRPFYFAVHPDLFAQHPLQRTTNEDSLKQLSAHMECLHERRLYAVNEPKRLKFYIRDEKATGRDTFKVIELTLDRRISDPKEVIERLLGLCNLPTEHLKMVKTVYAKPDASRPSEEDILRQAAEYGFQRGFEEGYRHNFYNAQDKAKPSLGEWVTENAPLALARSQELQELRDEVAKLQRSVVQRFGLQDVRYDCGWNYEHFRGCLKSLERLYGLHGRHMEVLRGRIVVFGSFTGVSLEGHVMLFTGDVLNSWRDFIANIPHQDALLRKIPLYERTLSQVLRQIKIGRRKFMPKQGAAEYAAHLSKVTTTLGDYLSTAKYPRDWPESLADYEIVIESEAGPLMVNPTGQLIAPAACPGFMLIDFIGSNLAVARERTVRYREQKLVESELIAECMRRLQLRSLTKDDSVTPDKMIGTLNNLMEDAAGLGDLAGVELHITNFYSVLSDGIVCIPWDYRVKQ